MELTAFADGTKIKVIKAVREMLGMGLVEAKNAVEKLPCLLKK